MTSRAGAWKIHVGHRDPLDLLVGARVRALRLQRRLSQRELGEAIGARAEDIGQFEAGLKRIGAARLVSIAGVLEIDVSSLFASDDRDDGGLHPPPSRTLH